MRALILSTDDEPVDGYAIALHVAGYDLVRCHAAQSPSFPCFGLTGDGCPLDAPGGVDVAVDVRQHPWPHPTFRESGVTCALRANVPVVVVSDHSHPFEHVGAHTVSSDVDVVVACDDAMIDALEPVRAAVADEVAAVFARHDVADEPFAVHLERHDGRLHLRIAASVPKAVGAIAATRAAVVIRRFDVVTPALAIELSPVGT